MILKTFMNAMLGLLNIGGGEVVVILALILLVFGGKKLPELAKGLGQGIKEFKKATRDVTDEFQSAVNEEPPIPPAKRLPPATTVANQPEGTASPAASSPKA
jgi:sec-independent protein translocase protein TatA